MARHNTAARRRRRPSSSSSPERAASPQDEDRNGASASAEEIHASGQRAPSSPAADPKADSSAPTSPVANPANPRALTGPVVPHSSVASGPRALSSPANDERNPSGQMRSQGHSEGGVTDHHILSATQRKDGAIGDDPIAETLFQLREELRQIRQERADRERKISLMMLQLPQKVPESGASNVASAEILSEFLLLPKGKQTKTEIPFCPRFPKPKFPQLRLKRARAWDKERNLL
jgi:hypothetical protein